ncbi:MAG: GAF domain-containing protein [Acidimicrobiales bacterium]
MDGVTPQVLRGTSRLRGDEDLTPYIGSPGLLRRVVDVGCQVAGASSGSIVMLGHDGEVGDLATLGVGFERRATAWAPIRGGILGEARSLRRPVRALLDDDPCLAGLRRGHGAAHALAVPLAIADEMIGILWVVREVHRDPFGDHEEHALAAFARHAALVLDNSRLRAEGRTWEPAVSAVKEVSHAMLEGRAAEDVLMLAVRSARRLLGAALTMVTTAEPSAVVVRVADGSRAGLVEGRRLSTHESAVSDVIRARRPLVLADSPNDGMHSRQITGMDGFGPALVVPMIVGDRVFGTFAALNYAGAEAFSAEDLLLVQAFAAGAAMALEHEQVQSELDRLRLLEERERIAMELHDGVVQALFVVGLSLQEAESVVDDADQMRVRLGRAIDSIDGAIRDLRDYIFGLRPADLADLHLERALRQVTENIERSGRVSTTVEFDARAASTLASDSANIIQAAREALSNAVKHSGGDRVGLRFVAVGDEVMLEISDNGHGFDVDAVKGKGHGLMNLRTRAVDLGGVLEIDSSVDAGTRVRIRVPI